MKNEILKSRIPLGYLIHEVARLIKRRFEEEAQTHGITLPQWRTLAVIAQNDGVPQSDIAAAIDADPMTMSGILDRLDKRGLIERYPDPKDSRAKMARITAEGHTLFEKARSVGITTYESALEGVDATQQQVAIAALTRMRENLVGQEAREQESA